VQTSLACGKHGNGPYAIRWDRSDDEGVKPLVDALGIVGQATITEALAALERLPRSGVVRETSAWVRHQARVTGKAAFSRYEIEAVIAQQVTSPPQRYCIDKYDLLAMTVQQAKNRYFEGVVILWPRKVGGDTEHKNGGFSTIRSRAPALVDHCLAEPRPLKERAVHLNHKRRRA
jgi:hypothetical protein